jgi:endonuclease/exonuclease/phosphatase family metal-dependent hydrolase
MARLHFEDQVTLANGTSAFPSDHVGVEATIDW